MAFKVVDVLFEFLPCGALFSTTPHRVFADLTSIKKGYSNQPWARTKLQKDAKCKDCRKTIPKGVTAWRSQDDGVNRMHRRCHDCILVAIRYWQAPD